MELRQLEFFLEVAKQNNFTKAAKRLRVAQPAISKAIKKLEEELGIFLFNRMDKTISLTPEGTRFLDHAKTILDQVHQATLEMQELRGLEKGEVTIGLPSMAGSYFFPNIIVDFKQTYPHLKLSVIEAGTKDIQTLIKQGDIDMGVIVVDRYVTNNLEVAPLLTEEMVVCAPPSHPFATQSSVSYEELASQPLILFKEGYYQRDIITEAGRQSNQIPNIAFETNQISLTKSLTRKGLGITLFLKMVVSDDDNLIARSLQPPHSLTLALAWRKQAYISKANRAFIDFLTARK